MKKLLSSFTAEGLLLGLGLTLLSYMITPIIQDLISEAKSNKKLMSNIHGNEAKLVLDKTSLR
ncbi:hypothetical protein F8154_05490 [Alkaliphilus pronyensis]|uniref:Uncharacterized protein n=1 Tax=Alkaliphilus pronyensis TaxID=1482732 RepID=A0A6I0FAC1_9FIRM|nr:hypothetical protein [Alkaliphilus pronyensis]KAB3535754.1 hypothetical protein F8154_05490 [Alkaliphilus pronyensis]